MPKRSKNYGLVNHVVAQAELLEFAKGIASKITKNSSVAIAKAIQAVKCLIIPDGSQWLPSRN